MNPSLTTLREYEVTIPCNLAILNGSLSIPSGAIGLVIFAHGSGSSRFSPRSRMDCVKSINLVSGATHLFQEPNALEEVAELAASWFERYLPEPQQEGTKIHEHAAQTTQAV